MNRQRIEHLRDHLQQYLDEKAEALRNTTYYYPLYLIVSLADAILEDDKNDLSPRDGGEPQADR